MRRVVLHVERLVLRGVDRSDAAAVGAALQAELRTLLGADGAGTLATQHGTRALQAGVVQLPPGTDAPALGRALASRIARVPGTGTP